MTERREADVVVIGAGLAGLSAARTLVQAGVEPVVVEARDRVGGRVVNESIGNGKIVEMGGQWMGPGQKKSSRRWRRSWASGRSRPTTPGSA